MVSRAWFRLPVFSKAILSVLLFSLSELMNVWYLDDITMGNTPMKVSSTVERLVTKMREIGLEFNGRKCQLTILQHSREEAELSEDLFRAIIPEIEVVPESRATLLGAPFGGGGVI